MTLLNMIQSSSRPSELTVALVGQPFWSQQMQLLAGGFVLAMVLGVAAASLLSLARRDRRAQGSTTRRLCRALGLDAPQRRLLENVARIAGIRSAAGLLISRGCFDIAQKRYAPQGVELRQLKRIRRRVFDD